MGPYQRKLVLVARWSVNMHLDQPVSQQLPQIAPNNKYLEIHLGIGKALEREHQINGQFAAFLPYCFDKRSIIVQD